MSRPARKFCLPASSLVHSAPVVASDLNDTSRFKVSGSRDRPSREPSVREACLVVMYGESIGRRISLTAAPLCIGRSAESDLQLEEESVSRNHCRIDPTIGAGGVPESWSVSDLGSTNGTYVNERGVESAVLNHGDHLQIGRNILKFLVSGHIESAYHEEIYRLVTTDGLTNLPNRRAFEDAMQREFSRSTRYVRPLSLLVIDIDHFKKINDVHGHLAGDAALRQFATLLKANLRRDDFAGRMGGEEFAVLLPEIDDAGARLTAEKLRLLTARHRFVFEEAVMPLTISVGVATRTPSDQDPMEIYRRGDELLFAAKRTGRNRVHG
ncbi:MAG: diguanylate cyclase [Deltaproteobacteria bacterium]|nr:diguanylate cyclase [Deltaproteobacteria bacterium]